MSKKVTQTNKNPKIDLPKSDDLPLDPNLVEDEVELDPEEEELHEILTPKKAKKTPSKTEIDDDLIDLEEKRSEWLEEDW